jgi:hypothetical protein
MKPASTSAPYYRVQFVGGPSDGLVLEAARSSFQPKDRISLSVRPVFAQFGETNCYEVLGHCTSTYLMTSKLYCQEGGAATVHLRYEFSAFESPLRRAARRHLPRPSRWLSALAGSRAWRKFAKWMLAPVDHPLKITPLR